MKRWMDVILISFMTSHRLSIMTIKIWAQIQVEGMISLSKAWIWICRSELCWWHDPHKQTTFQIAFYCLSWSTHHHLSLLTSRTLIHTDLKIIMETRLCSRCKTMRILPSWNDCRSIVDFDWIKVEIWRQSLKRPWARNLPWHFCGARPQACQFLQKSLVGNHHRRPIWHLPSCLRVSNFSNLHHLWLPCLALDNVTASGDDCSQTPYRRLPRPPLCIESVILK